MVNNNPCLRISTVYTLFTVLDEFLLFFSYGILLCICLSDKSQLYAKKKYEKTKQKKKP